MSDSEAAKSVREHLEKIQAILSDLPAESKLKEDFAPAVGHLLTNAAGHEVESSDDPYDPTDC